MVRSVDICGTELFLEGNPRNLFTALRDLVGLLLIQVALRIHPT